MKTPLPLRAAALLVAGLALAGCSGGGDDGGAAATTAPPLSTGSTPAGESPSESPSDAATDVAGAAGTQEEQLVTDFCTARSGPLRDISQQLSTASPDQLAGILPQAVTTLDGIEPPAGVAADFSTFRDGMRALDDAVEGASSQAELATRIAAVGQERGAELTAASQRMGTWADANCPPAG